MFWFHVIFLAIAFFVIGRMVTKSLTIWEGWAFFAIPTLFGFIGEKWGSTLEMEAFNYFSFICGFIVGAALIPVLAAITVNLLKLKTDASYHIFMGIVCIILAIILFSMRGVIGGMPSHNHDDYSSDDSSYSDSYNSSSGGDYSSTSHKCYVCGKSGNILYGSHYYCSTHYAYVKTIVDNS